jgi:hypothetical protein
LLTLEKLRVASLASRAPAAGTVLAIAMNPPVTQFSTITSRA